MTATAADLQTEFRRLRDVYHETGDGRYETRLAYDAWFHQSCLEGKPPDALRRDSGSENERFFSRTIPGVDGHTYWEGGVRFRLDSGGERNMRWWWYEYVNGPQERGTLGAVCGERNCITPDHQRFISWGDARRRYSDQQMLGALQVAAQRLGEAPTMNAYRALKLRPHPQVIAVYFGSWETAVRAAGLEPSAASTHKRSPDDCIAGLQHLARVLGHPPTYTDYQKNHALLREAGLPPSATTVRDYLGTWAEALEKAGLT